MKRPFGGALALTAVLLSGCVFNAQTVNLNPVVSSPHDVQGHGITVAVRVEDQRPSQSLGRRGTGAAEITTASDVAAIVLDKVTNALQDQGFTVVPWGNPGEARLTVEVRFLHYSGSMGFWTVGAQVQAALMAVAGKSGQTFEHMYRTNDEQRGAFAPTSDSNASMINNALGAVITKMVNDKQLVAFLAG